MSTSSPPSAEAARSQFRAGRRFLLLTWKGHWLNDGPNHGRDCLFESREAAVSWAQEEYLGNYHEEDLHIIELPEIDLSWITIGAEVTTVDGAYLVRAVEPAGLQLQDGTRTRFVFRKDEGKTWTRKTLRTP